MNKGTQKRYDLTEVKGLAEFMMDRAARRVQVTIQKNNDYADPDGHAEDDFKVFRNFMMAETMGICSAETGLLVRLSDKFMRAVNLMREGHVQAVADEALEDTLLDLQNYVDLLAGLMYLKKSQNDKMGEDDERNQH